MGSTMAHEPSFICVEKVQRIFLSLGLPVELALVILQYALYFPELEFHRSTPLSLLDTAWSLEASAAQVYLYAGPILKKKASEKARIREVKFVITSFDQGWTSGPDRGRFFSKSWWLQGKIAEDLLFIPCTISCKQAIPFCSSCNENALRFI